ncbi:MAG: hypothetical protein MI717_04700 [Spirochaetales bacterium]|nr:hypothetical protein [Spirochaetales bacterium]
MYLNSDHSFLLTHEEARTLWDFLNTHNSTLNPELAQLTRRLEAKLWDTLSIGEMQEEQHG